MKFSTLWRTALAWIGGIILTIILIPPGLIALALDPFKQRLAQPMVQFWASTIMRFCFIEVRIIGVERLKGAKSVVFAANHQSLMDIFLLLGFLNKRVGFLAKKQTLWIPVIGILMMMLGHIFVDRSNPRKSLKSVKKCIKAVEAGRSIAIFPEGTRTRDGQMQQFKSGSLRIPVRTGVPVVPVTICGTFNVMPRDTFGVKPHPVVMHVGEPISTEGIERADFRPFVARVESVIRATKEELERQFPGAAPVASDQTVTA